MSSIYVRTVYTNTKKQNWGARRKKKKKSPHSLLENTRILLYKTNHYACEYVVGVEVISMLN